MATCDVADLEPETSDFIGRAAGDRSVWHGLRSMTTSRRLDDWDNLSDPEVLSDAYLSGLTIREMSQKSGLSESWLREKLRSMDLIF